MSKEDKKNKYNNLLKELAHQRKQALKKRLSDHDFIVDGETKRTSNLFDQFLFRALLEQAEGLSLTFNKPHSYQVEDHEVKRLSNEAYETLDKAAILRPTRLGPLTLIG